LPATIHQSQVTLPLPRRRRTRPRCWTRPRRRRLTGNWKRERQAPSTSDHAGISRCKIDSIQTPDAGGVCPAKYRRESGAISSGWSRIAICRRRPRRREAVVRIVRGGLISSCSPGASRRQLRGSCVAERVGDIRHCPVAGAVLYKQSSASGSYQHNPNIVRERMG
jgi:hypothetical protein